MAILTPPAAPRYASGRFGAQPNTLTHVSPLDRTADTVELPGVRWMFDAALPAMDETEAAAWTAFLSQLGGQAGRFYAGDPWRIAPRGPAGVIAAHQNDIPNNTMQGAVVGTIGSGGALPTGWVWNNGAMNAPLTVDGFGVEDGVEYIDLTVSGTNTTGGDDFPNVFFAPSGSIAAAPSDQWVVSAYGKHFGVASSPVASLSVSFRDSGLLQTNSGGASFALTTSLARTEIAAVAAASTASVRGRVIWAVPDTATLSASIRLGLPQLEEAAVASAPIRTSGTALTKPAGPFVEGAAQIGSAILTGGWDPDTAPLLIADYVSFDLPSGGRSLHKLTAAAASDITGEATLAIYPPLRESPADKAPVLLSPANCVMQLINDDQARWDVDTAGFYHIAFAAVESFDDGA